MVAVVGAAAAAVVVAVVDPLVLRWVLREDFRQELLNSCRLWVSLVSYSLSLAARLSLV